MTIPPDPTELIDFLFRHKCTDFGSAYITALKILGEEAKNQWTHEVVIEAVLRASKKETSMIVNEPIQMMIHRNTLSGRPDFYAEVNIKPHEAVRPRVLRGYGNTRLEAVTLVLTEIEKHLKR